MIIKFFAYIRDYTHTKETNMDQCETVEELLKKLCSKYGKKLENKVFEDNKLSAEIIILVNGRHIDHCNGIHTKLKQDDVICIFPVVAGG
ncbi:ubiquitin-like small modifier protein 1 [Bacillus sp. 1NLA3E]|uniref:ubiquitin-like small modifier protein 1 n=1 Tax=Bacillus sp. 1NLA3E TaxID=666686 RepID=UPI0002F10052|nr:ubiquitin-like small modifier protein 1 [Bacillus sp. 1NLA3E]